jgi:hypothetical protein
MWLASPALQAQNIEKKIVGKWFLQSMELDIQNFEDVPADMRETFNAQRAEFEAETAKYKDKAYFDFRKDKSIGVYDEDNPEKVGKWRIEGGKVFMNKESGADEESFEVSFEGNILILKISNPEFEGVSLLLKMKK